MNAILRRRDFLKIGASTVAAAVGNAGRSAGPPTLLMIHGRDQQGQDPAALKAEWLDALRAGAAKINRSLPGSLEVLFPYYGDALEKLTQQADVPLTPDIQARGEASVDEDFLSFQAEVADSIREAANVSEAQVDAEYGPNVKQKGPLNWEWVQAIFQAVDKHGGGVGALALQKFTRDVYLYTRRAGVRSTIDRIVTDTITSTPTVVVGHSLGSVVAYSVLQSGKLPPQVPVFVTVGSPLGIRAVRDQFKPLRHPTQVAAWYNAFDRRDVVALYELDGDNFPVKPRVQNSSHVMNSTSNRHGIIGYLDDADVARKILDGLGA